MNIRSLPSLISAASIAWSIPHSVAGEFPLEPLTEAPAASDEAFFKVKDGEATIGGEVIKLFVVKPEHLTVSYRNETDKGLFPKYVVRLYNRYGILLSSEKIGVSLFGGSTKLEPGDVGGEKIHLDLIDLEEIFQHAVRDLPDDFDDAAWLSLSDSNSKLGPQEEAGQ
ncbi:hypothetical protein [Haloferula sp. A504]|uniref:hypothetical protein n=1 Tax=Haloferula sp. A504 TaxID=3373601 RepID=UPI0031C80A24|nr:hypothetical protein [Verrucomicrobiaceae bacterium E54]